MIGKKENFKTHMYYIITQFFRSNARSAHLVIITLKDMKVIYSSFPINQYICQCQE